MNTIHSFFIPVMGIGYTIDSPVKVAKYGISSVISLVDDTLIEEMRKYYCSKFGEAYTPISKYEEDHRARRITAYLNLLDKIVKKQFEELQSSAFEIGSEITKYFELLPGASPLKKLYTKMLKTSDPQQKKEMQENLRNSIQAGSIDVNIMTKLDRVNFDKQGTALSPEYSDALAALRGYAKSSVQSAIVFSAGINQRLYSYLEEFKDFYADAKGSIKKKIILKVSDYRSSIIQGKFFAKKGLWVSEYRIESGLNCGGHAFATTGHLMGPILEEFKNKRQELTSILHTICNQALKIRNKMTFSKPREMKITAQGGIGTAAEDRFLQSHYEVDETGWGTPFLLCPEVSNADEETLEKLCAASEEDLYLSDVSPLGVPFNNLRGNLSDTEKERKAALGRPGSACIKGHLAFNTDYTDKPLCTASRLYQKLKLSELEKQGLTEDEYKQQWDKVIMKACICNDLGEGVRRRFNIAKEGSFFSAVCPGPNIAYFSKIFSLADMVGHIYGRKSILNAKYRPNMFIKELDLYVDYLMKEVKKCAPVPSEKQIQYFQTFITNLLKGMEYYRDLFPRMLSESKEYHKKMLEELKCLKEKLEDFVAAHPEVFSKKKVAIPV